MREREAGSRAERLARSVAPLFVRGQARLAGAGLRFDLLELSWTERRPLTFPFAQDALWGRVSGWLLELWPYRETVKVTVRFEPHPGDCNVAQGAAIEAFVLQ